MADEDDRIASDMLGQLLTDLLKSIALMRMMEHTIDELATDLELSESQPRRKLRLIETLRNEAEHGL